MKPTIICFLAITISSFGNSGAFTNEQLTTQTKSDFLEGAIADNLTSESSFARADAVETIGMKKLVNFLPDVVRILKNPREETWIRSLAATTFIRLDRSKALPQLVKISQTSGHPTSLRGASLRALAAENRFLGLPIVVEFIVDKNAPQGLRLESLKMLSSFSNDLPSTPLFQLIRSQEEPLNIRKAAINALSSFGNLSSNWRFLADEMLLKSDSRLLEPVISTLRRISQRRLSILRRRTSTLRLSTSHIAKLASIITENKDTFGLPSDALSILGMSGQEDSRKVLLRLLDDPQNVYLKTAIIGQLGRFPHVDVLRKLVGIAGNVEEKADVVLEALKNLGKVSSHHIEEEDWRTLWTLIENKLKGSEEEREATIIALGSLNYLKKANSLLLKIAKSPNEKEGLKVLGIKNLNFWIDEDSQELITSYAVNQEREKVRLRLAALGVLEENFLGDRSMTSSLLPGLVNKMMGNIENQEIDYKSRSSTLSLLLNIARYYDLPNEVTEKFLAIYEREEIVSNKRKLLRLMVRFPNNETSYFLLKCFEDLESDLDLREACLQSLFRNLSGLDRLVLKSFLQRAKDRGENIQVRRPIIENLWKIGVSTESFRQRVFALDLINDLIKDKSEPNEIRRSAVYSAGEVLFESSEERLIDSLLEIIKDETEDLDLRNAGIYAFEDEENVKVREEFVRILGDPQANIELRLLCLEHLEYLEPESRDDPKVRETLINLVDGQEVSVLSIRSLVLLGKDPKVREDVYRRLLSNQKISEIYRALSAWILLKKDTNKLEEETIKVLTDQKSALGRWMLESQDPSRQGIFARNFKVIASSRVVK